MPTQSVDALFRSLKKGDLAPVYYLYGPEDVLKDEAVKTILDRALDPTLRDFNFDQRSAAQLDAEEVHALCNTLPMLADRRVVLLRDVEGWKRKTKGRAEFIRYLQRPSPETVVIMVQGSAEEADDKELAAGACTGAIRSAPPERARKWLLHQASRLGLTLEPEAAEHLMRSVGFDLSALTSELAKLASLPAGRTAYRRAGGRPGGSSPRRDALGLARGRTGWPARPGSRTAAFDSGPARRVRGQAGDDPRHRASGARHCPGALRPRYAGTQPRSGCAQEPAERPALRPARLQGGSPAAGVAGLRGGPAAGSPPLFVPPEIPILRSRTPRYRMRRDC